MVTLAIPHASKSLEGENSSRNRLSDSMYEIMGSGMSIDIQKTYPKLGEPRECTVLNSSSLQPKFRFCTNLGWSGSDRHVLISAERDGHLLAGGGIIR